MNTVLRYKDIIFYRTLAGLKSEARKNYLGYLWFVLEPLMSTGVLYFAMSHLTGSRGTGAIFTILVGMLAWQWFEGSIMLSAASLTTKFHIHLQVPLPKYLFPLVDIGTHTVRFACAFTLVVIVGFFLVQPPTLALLWLPVVLALQLAFIVSFSLMSSIAVTLMPDLQVLLQSLFRLLFFVSGIFFSVDRVPANLLVFFQSNPITIFIESYRAILLRGHSPSPGLLAYTAALSMLFFCAGGMIQSYFDKRLLKLTNV